MPSAGPHPSHFIFWQILIHSGYVRKVKETVGCEIRRSRLVEINMKKNIMAFALIVMVTSHPASAYQQNDGTGSGGTSGGRASFCSAGFAMPFGFVFRPCSIFG